MDLLMMNGKITRIKRYPESTERSKYLHLIRPSFTRVRNFRYFVHNETH